MHPRNPYKTPPNFTELAKTFPEFAEVSLLDPNGKVRLDFKNQESIRILTTCLLKKDFNLDVKIPQDRLVPTLTSRINYILWLEDLLEFIGRKDEIVGIDIGTGAAAIYCLLSATMKKWKMLGLELDELNLELAKENVSRNKLEDLVTIIAQDKKTDKLLSKLDFSTNVYDFCMMNPPFFNSTEEITNSENRTGKRKHSSSQIRGAETEVVFEGGENEFVKRLIQESLELKDKVKLYTTMLGHKSSLGNVKELLRDSGVPNFTTTEFVQGKTMRWGIAWSFCEDFNLGSFGASSSTQFNLTKKNSHILNHQFPNTHKISFELATNNLIQILTKIKFKIKTIEENSKRAVWEISAFEKNWLNMRRKRREKMRQEALGVGPSQITIPFQHYNQVPSLFLGLELSEVIGGFDLQIFYISGSFGKVSAGEVLQYIKNNFKTQPENSK